MPVHFKSAILLLGTSYGYYRYWLCENDTNRKIFMSEQQFATAGGENNLNVHQLGSDLIKDDASVQSVQWNIIQPLKTTRQIFTH